VDFSLQLTNDTFYPPNHKTHFSFALGCPQDFNFAWQFWCGRVETGLNWRKWMGKLKLCMHSRAKLKHVLWLGDLKASLINCIAITRHLLASDCWAWSRLLMLRFSQFRWTRGESKNWEDVNMKSGKANSFLKSWNKTSQLGTQLYLTIAALILATNCQIKVASVM
jgi:hypothetical protein